MNRNEYTMRLSRIVMAWLEDMHNHALHTNMALMMRLYNDNERAIAYQFIRKYKPTFNLLTPKVFYTGEIDQSKFFDAIYTLMEHYPH